MLYNEKKKKRKHIYIQVKIIFQSKQIKKNIGKKHQIVEIYER